MNRVLSIIGYVFAWIAVVGVVALFAMKSHEHREALVVKSVDVMIVDSVSSDNLVTSQMVHDMLKSSRMSILGERAAQLPLQQIESTIAKNGFVKGVEVYVNYEGEMTIEVEQRTPIARILLDGYNCYLTSDGFIFDAPRSTALYTTVITGDYRPLFKAGYVGYIDDYKKMRIEQLEQEIERVEREKYPIYLRERENDEARRDVRKRFINRSAFESKDDFAKRVADLRNENQTLRNRYAYRQKVIDAELKALEKQQEHYREEQKKVEKKCDNIYNLITFVRMVERDDFWRSEIVQIDLEEGDSSDRDMRVSLAVRSAKFIVTMGELTDDRDDLKSKFNRLRSFYDEALTRVGWDRYREINIEYKNQVVCRK